MPSSWRMGWTAKAGDTAKSRVDRSEPVVSSPASEQPGRAVSGAGDEAIIERRTTVSHYSHVRMETKGRALDEIATR